VVSGTAEVFPTEDTLYSVTCSGEGGSVTKTTQVSVAELPPATVYLKVSTEKINLGESVTLSWETADASTCTGTGFNTGGSVNGAVTVSPTINTVYAIQCDSTHNTHKVGDLARVIVGQGNVVNVSPSDDVQALINANPAGTTYQFSSGVYRNFSVDPKTGDTFIGNGALLTGANVLTNWQFDGTYWFVDGQTQQGQVHGSCLASHPRCNRPEDVFVNDQPLFHTDSLATVDADSYFFDYEADRIYLGQDPTGKTIEVSTTRNAFGPSNDGENVAILGFIVEKYAIPPQMGSIGDQKPPEGWIIENNEVRYNHGAGVRLANLSFLRNNYIHHNGQIGAAGVGDNMLLEGNEISFNNYAGFSSGWEAGGFKIVRTLNAVIRLNYVHSNLSHGLWTDIDNIHSLYEYNIGMNNASDGFKHEISYDVVIRDNIAIDNGIANDVWLWGSSILIQNSPNATVYRNYVRTMNSGNGIGIIEQNRGSGAFGDWLSQNVNIYDNEIIHSVGKTGAVGDATGSQLYSPVWGIRFNRNRYHVSNLSSKMFNWSGGGVTFDDFQNSNQEHVGTIDTNLSVAPPAPSIVLNADKTTIAAGEEVKLSYEGRLATSCTADFKTDDNVVGTAFMSPTVTTTYTVDCEGIEVSTSESITIVVQ
jgi:hypothetical protein